MNTAPKLTVMSDTRFIPAAAPAIECCRRRNLQQRHPGATAR